MSIGAVRPNTPVRTARPAAAAAPAAPATPAAAPRPVKAIKAQGPVDTGSKIGGTIAGTAAGVGGALSIALLWMIGGGSFWSGGPVGIGLMALATVIGTGLGYLGGDRIGDMLEGKQAAGKKYVPAQIAGGAVGGVLGLAGGFWFGMLALGSIIPGPIGGLVLGGGAAVLGALGGAEGAKRLTAKIFG